MRFSISFISFHPLSSLVFSFYDFSSLSLLGFVELTNIMTECSCYCFSCGKLSMKNIDFCTLL
jgi:hypothetical protein